GRDRLAVVDGQARLRVAAHAADDDRDARARGRVGDLADPDRPRHLDTRADPGAPNDLDLPGAVLLPVRRAGLLGVPLPQRRSGRRRDGVGMTTVTPTAPQPVLREQTRDGLRLLYLRARVCIERHHAQPLTLG